MQAYEVFDAHAPRLLNAVSIIYAETGRKAMDAYLRDMKLNIKVRASGDRDARYCVSPIALVNGQVYSSRGKQHHATWYKVIG